MPGSAKISISLPKRTLEIADRERRATGESRSQLFRRAVEALVERRRREEAIELYRAGYVAEPEAEYDVDDLDRLGEEILERESWD